MFESMTVAELKALLEDQDDEALVTFESNYGDRGRTRQVHTLHGRIEEQPLRETGYSESGYAIAEREYDGPEDDAQTVLVIS